MLKVNYTKNGNTKERYYFVGLEAYVFLKWMKEHNETADTLAGKFFVHPNTIRGWIQEGKPMQEYDYLTIKRLNIEGIKCYYE